MDLSKIDKQIADYTFKMNKKVPVKTKGKRKWKDIPKHLRKFYEEEITKLENQKTALLNQKEYYATIGWDNIIFENYHIRVNINNHFSEPFQLLESRSSYEFLKPYILKSDLKPLSVSIFGNTITSINNLGELNTIIKILSIQEEINFYFNDFESTRIDKILSKLKIISNQNLFEFFKLKHKSLYLGYLCEVQSKDYRVIPTTEILMSNERIVSEEDTFLFTIKSLDRYYIIWESTLINKATYIFQTSESLYPTDVQRLFDFIASNQNSKRRKLRFSIKNKENPLKSIRAIEHNNIDKWIAKIKSIVQS